MIPVTRRPFVIALAVLTGFLVGSSAMFADAATLSRLYLQQPTSSSIIVRWRTDVPEDSRVEWGLAPGSLNSVQDDATVTTEHEVKITGLEAATTYFYRVGSTTTALAGGDADHYFKTSPPTGTASSLRILALGDSGFPEPLEIPGYGVRNAPAVRDAYKDFNNGVLTADVVLLLGDNAYNTATDEEYQAALFDLYGELLRNSPAWATIGNHEGYSNNSLTQVGTYFDIFTIPTQGEAGGIPSGTESYYSFDYGNVHFVVLDTEDSIEIAYPHRAAMKTWLEADLAATQQDWVIALWHRPPYSKGLLHDSDVEQNEILARVHLNPILEDYGVSIVLSGHSHSIERSMLISGHYGFSNTFGPEFIVDGGDGDPNGDGAYEKANRGRGPGTGTIYVVAGSASEKRVLPETHPVMAAAMSELASFVLDIDDQRAVGTFVSETGRELDTFTIEKGTACSDSPTAVCTNMPNSKLRLARGRTPGKEKLVWNAKGGAISESDFGVPMDQTLDEIDLCLYDANGYVAGGRVASGNAYWTHGRASVYKFRDRKGVPNGMMRARFRMKDAAKAAISVKGSGAALALSNLPLTLPVTVQAKSSAGGCWESTFSAASRNDSTRFLAK